MVDAAEIEPSQQHATPDALTEQHQNTFLYSVCEIYVKWAQLPSSVRKAVEEWHSLPKHVREGIEAFLNQTQADDS